MGAASKSLWVIADDLAAVGERIAENLGELTPKLEAELEALEGEFAEKVERVALYVRTSEGLAEQAKVEKDRLAAIQKHHEAKARGLKTYLLAVMERHGRDKVDTYKARVSRVANSRPSVRWQGNDYADIPDRFRRDKLVQSLNSDAVLEAASNEEPIDPRIVIERGHHVRIG